MYPYRATANPDNVVYSIGQISANSLKNFIGSSSFPKESVLQHLMMAGITANLTSKTNVYPENSHIIVLMTRLEGHWIFFVSGNLRWGVELMVQGRKMKEHRERLIGEGKYVALACSQYIVVDFRANDDGFPRHYVENDCVITVFLSIDDYESATIL
jgi:hypothetical protein